MTQTDDIFTFPLISYNNEITQAESLNLKGVGVKTFNLVMLTDFSITQTNKATVAAYTQLDSAAKLYDYAKSYLVDTYAGEAQTLLTRQDDLIDARALNMVFLADYSATATYVVGSYVYHSGAVYKCATAITTAQAFTAGNWTRLMDTKPTSVSRGSRKSVKHG